MEIATTIMVHVSIKPGVQQFGKEIIVACLSFFNNVYKAKAALQRYS